MRFCSIALAGLTLWAPGCLGPSQVGDPCQTDAQCGREDGFDLACQVSVPGGYCTVRDCTPDDPATPEVEGQASCPASSRCVQDGARQSFVCRLSCQTRDECREVWACGQAGCENLMTCAPVHPGEAEVEGVARTCVYAPPPE